jgi:hypothetical protein
MWRCKCGTPNDDRVGKCWNCGASRPEASAVAESEIPESVSSIGVPTANLGQEVQLQSTPTTVANRYRDAYIVAKVTAGIGATVKAIGVILGGLIVLGGIIASSQNGILYFFAGLLLGVVVAVPIFVLGVLVAAQGQVLKATLDTAVHSSPFLTKEEMARVMGIK